MRIVITDQFFSTKFVVLQIKDGFLVPVLDLETTEEFDVILEKIKTLPNINEIVFIGKLGVFKKIEEYYKNNHAEVTIIWQ